MIDDITINSNRNDNVGNADDTVGQPSKSSNSDDSGNVGNADDNGYVPDAPQDIDVSQLGVINNLFVSGAQLRVDFEKYTTPDIPSFKIIVSNSSNAFGLRFFHTKSMEDRITIISGSTTIDSANPVTLPANSGSNINSVELLAIVNSNQLNYEPLETTLEGNQLVENIYFNAVAIKTSTNTQTIDDIEINTVSNLWRDLTQKGNDGVGIGYQESSRANIIVFEKNKLESKLSKLKQFKLFFDRGFGGYVGIIGRGDSSRARRQRGFKILLYSILFETQPRVNFLDVIVPFRPSDGNAVSAAIVAWRLPNSQPSWESFFPWGGLPNFEGTLNSASYPAQIINKYIKLIEDILEPTEGLSNYVPAIVTSNTAPDESSRITTQVGQLDIDVVKASYSISDAILSSSKALINLKTLQFFDQEREYKTVLNLGNDRQYVLEAWRPVSSDSSSIQLKLRRPLDPTINLFQTAYIVRDFANPIIDVINFELSPPTDDTPFLRPKNLDVGKFQQNNQSIKGVTLNTLQLMTGSVGNISSSIISYDDRVFNRWYTSDFNSSELNIDFSDYNNFVFFGSAKARLDAFANKLQKIQSYGNIQVNSSTSDTGERKLAIESELIKRNFDAYEQFLYFASQSVVYTASAYYADFGVEYNATGSWPKNGNMSPLPYVNVENWYATQSAIAERFDEFNPNYLVKHLPGHIQEDTNSEDFVKFIQMFGHVMDNIKLYVDQFSNIYSTSPDPFKELSMDQTYEVAKSFGLNLPNAYSLENLNSFISSLYDGEGARSLVAETWKRFLHSSIYLRKLKGSRTGADAVINTYGINSPLVQVKESAYPSNDNYIKSEESAYAIFLTGSVSSSIRIPFVSSSYTASNIQIRFIPEYRQKSSLLTTNGTWGVYLVPHPSASTQINFNATSSRNLTSYFTINPNNIDYGRLEVVSGSSASVIASSSYFPLFGDVHTHIMLQSQSQNIIIVQTDGDQILHEESASVQLGSLWNTNHVFLGGTGSLRVGNFDGIIDDVRVWGEEITIDNFKKQAYDPASYYATTYSSSYNNLYVDISFSQPYTAITQSATNESPFYDVAKLSNIPTTGLTTESYVRVVRSIKQFVPVVGASSFSNRKIIVATPPIFNKYSVDSNGTKTLKLNTSIKSLEEKKYVGGQDYVQFAVSPTDFVNQTIMRSMGDIDTNYLIGSPRKYNNERYTELDDIFEFFLENYNESIDANKYIRFFRNVLKSPSDYMESYVPARAKLVNGIVIESSILNRQKTYLQKAIKVDGSNTVTFDKFTAGSGSTTASVNYDAGAYDFLAYYPAEEQLDTTVITNPFQIIQKIGINSLTSSLASSNGGIGMVNTTIDLADSVGPVSSTLSSKLPTFRQLIQLIGTATEQSSSYATSSIADNNSSIGFVDANIDATARNFVTQSGYPRNPYLGLRYNQTSSLLRINSEVNTFTPIYAVPPRSDFTDAGTTSYFHLSSGLYWFDPYIKPFKRYATGTKQYLRAKFNIPTGVEATNTILEFNNLTLIDPQLLSDYPGRFSTNILTKQFDTITPFVGVLTIANIISLYYLEGASGLRVRLYATQTDQSNDINRSFTTLPDSSTRVLFDGILNSDGQVFPYTLMQTQNSTMYITVNNTTGSPITSNIKLTYFEYEPTNLVPKGYLPRHYKFTRTENIATLRKSYLGCKAVYCPEGCPPDLVDPNNKVGRVLPRRQKNGNIGMPQLLLESDSPVQVFSSPRTGPTVNNPNRGGSTSYIPPVGTLPPVGTDFTKFGGQGPLK